jgi:hypothetical protein
LKSGGESSPAVQTIQTPPPRRSNALHPHPSNIARSNAYEGYDCGSREMGAETYRPGAPLTHGEYPLILIASGISLVSGFASQEITGHKEEGR